MKIKPLSLLCAATGGFIPLSLQAQYNTDLIGYWQFENDLVESSGAHTAGTHDGTAVGTVPYVAGPLPTFGQGIDLDGTNGVIVNGTDSDELGYVSTFDAGVANNLSISFWASGIPGRWSPFVSKNGEGSTGYQVRRHNNNGNATFTLRDTAGTDDPQGAIDIGTGQPVWTHYVATWNGTTGERKLYVNGVEDIGVAQTGDIAATGPGNADAFLLAFGLHNDVDTDSASFQRFFNGDMDDVAIWSRELNSIEAYQLGQAPLSAILLETDADGDGLFASQEATFGTSDSDVDSDNDGIDDFAEFVKGSDGTVDNDFDGDGLTNLEETSGSNNPFVSGLNTGVFPGEATNWCVADSDGDGLDDGDELDDANGFTTDPNNADTDGDGFSDNLEITEGSNPLDATSLPPITAGLVGYWEFENNLTETSGAHTAGTHDAATTDGFPAEYATGPTIAVDGVTLDFGSALNTVADGSNYGVFVRGSNSTAGTTEEPYVNTFDAGIGNEFSISFWAEGFPGNWNPLIAKNGESTGYQIRRRSSSSNAVFTLRGTTGTDDPNVANTAGNNQPSWRHYVGTWNGITGERKLYLDGALIITETNDFAAGGPGNADAFWLTFGARHDDADPLTFGNLLAGKIDDVAFWHRELRAVEAVQLSTAPLSFVLSQIDEDQDGLFLTQELEFNTLDTNPDTDGDGINDLDEFNKGSIGNLDDDPDNDGLLNSQETSGSANPWIDGVESGVPGDITDWCVTDSDFDGINDGDEVDIANGFITDPNNADTDSDGFSDGIELAASTDPRDAASVPTNWLAGLCGYWQFDSDLTDSSATGADGTLAGLDLTETYATGQFGQSIDLRNINEQRVEISSIPESAFDAAGSDLTVSAWVQVETLAAPWQTIIAKGEGSSWRIARRNGVDGATFSAGTGNAGVPALEATAGNFPLNDGGWHHVVGRARNGVDFTMWIDGILVETRTDVLPNITDNFSILQIGGNPEAAGRTWDGRLDDIAVWKRALTDNEVTTLFFNGNELQHLIDNDVTPTDPPVIVDVEINACFFDGAGDFNVDVTGLNPTANYQMMRSLLLDGTDWLDVGTAFTGGATNTFVDPDPVDRAFYQIFEVIPE